MNGLRKTLKDWTDVDGAQHELAKCLGLIDPEATFLETKHLWWSNTAEGSMMYNMLCCLEDEGVLIVRAEPDLQYKWCGGEERCKLPDGYRRCCGHLVEESEPCPFCDKGFQ